jgi:hypothetical protein
MERETNLALIAVGSVFAFWWAIAVGTGLAMVLNVPQRKTAASTAKV